MILTTQDARSTREKKFFSSTFLGKLRSADKFQRKTTGFQRIEISSKSIKYETRRTQFISDFRQRALVSPPSRYELWREKTGFVSFLGSGLQGIVNRKSDREKWQRKRKQKGIRYE